MTEPHLNPLKGWGFNVNSSISILGFLGMFAGGVSAWSSLTYDVHTMAIRLDKADVSSDARKLASDLRFAKIEDKAMSVEPLEYRTTTLEAKVVEQNSRLDRVSSSISEKLDILQKDINDLGKSLALLTQRLDFMRVPTDPGKRSEMSRIPSLAVR